MRPAPAGRDAGGPELRTARLVLRRWRSEDRRQFAAINADPIVMEHFPAPLSRQQSDALVDAIEAGFERHGFGLWAVEAPGGGGCIGFTGLSVPTFQAHFTPAVEVGWRLSRLHWGRGYATEAARAAVAFGFEEAGLDEIVSFTIPANERSRRVMDRLGMTHEPSDDFDHPRIPVGDPIRRHVLYRLRASDWRHRRAEG